MSIVAESVSKRPKFTPEQARAAALRSHEERRIRKLAQCLTQPEPVAQAAAQATQLDEYRLRRLTRVRRQLDKLDAMIQDEIDPQKLDRLASAQAKLAEQERQLSDRSLPPSLRAPTVKTRQSRSGSNSMPEPTPIGE